MLKLIKSLILASGLVGAIALAGPPANVDPQTGDETSVSSDPNVEQNNPSTTETIAQTTCEHGCHPEGMSIDRHMKTNVSVADRASSDLGGKSFEKSGSKKSTR